MTLQFHSVLKTFLMQESATSHVHGHVCFYKCVRVCVAVGVNAQSAVELSYEIAGCSCGCVSASERLE